jgi:RHS repeat-associated protein
MVVNESKPNSGNGTELRPVPTLDVWFDDIEVVHTEALIVQENHYDPYGLSLSGIEKENKPEDKWKFQDKELITELDLNWQDFGARFYDPQLGRWHCVDPADQFSSSYVGLGNNPVTAVDPDGRLAFLPILIGAAIGGVFNLAIKASQGQIGSFKDGLVAFGIGAAGGAVTAATGGAVAGVLGLPATGVISGAVTGAAGSAVGGPVTGIGNSVYFGDSYSSKDWGTGIVTGGVIGGATGGVAALIKGNNFWTGAPRGINPITGSKSNPFSFKNGDYLEENGWQRLSIGKWARGWSEDPDITDVYLGSKRLSRFAGVDYPDPRGNTGGWGAAKGGTTFFEGASYSSKVLKQMGKADDLFHGFPKSVDGFATKFGQWSTKLGADGKPYQWLKMPGSYGGKTGVFEYTKDANGLINHRFFNVPK